MQNYMLERLLERISISEYHDYFILKGGFLIAAMVGLDTRATMDIDATIKKFPVTEETVKEMFLKISGIYVDDDVTFEFKSIEQIRENDDYDGFRVSIIANYAPMTVPLKLDITTGDKITPREIEYEFKLLIEDRTIKILAYNLETVLSEKMETIISRGDQNTRPRDYYDVYILTKLQSKNIDIDLLKQAFYSTCQKRQSVNLINRYKEIIEDVRESTTMNKQWEIYQKDFNYAKDISFDDICNSILEILNRIKQL